MEDLPDLSQFEIEPTEGPWKGIALHLGSNNTFTGNCSSIPQFLELCCNPGREEAHLPAITSIGPMDIQGLIPSHLSSEGPVRGTIKTIVLSHSIQNSEQLLLRRFVMNRNNKAEAIRLPDVVEYQDRQHFYSCTEFEILDRPVKWIQIPEGRGFVYEMGITRTEHMDGLRQIESHLHNVDRLFQLFFGQEWGEEFAFQICDQTTRKPLETVWKRAIPRNSSGLAIIPCSFQDLHTAQSQFPDKGIPACTDFKRLAPCITSIVNNPELMIPIDLMIQINRLPLNTRGIMLAVALEALTDLISKRVNVPFEPLIGGDIWTKFHLEMKNLIDALPPLSEDENRNKDKRKTLFNRVADLGRPTNTAKLKMPFDLYGIPLSEDDLDALGKRNKALHTGRLIGSGSLSELTIEDWRKVNVLEQRLYLAVAKLLLKFMNYNGPIVDWASTAIGEFPPKCAYI